MTKRIFLLFSSLFFSAPILQAQSDGYLTNSNFRGVTPPAAYQIGEIDSVNLGTGAVNLNLPLWSRAGRGIDTKGELIYSSKLWAVHPEYHDPLRPLTVTDYVWQRSPDFKARIAGNFGSLNWIEEVYGCSSGGNQFSVRVLSNFLYTSASGSVHRFPNRHYRPTLNLVCSGLNATKVDQGLSDSGTMELDTTVFDNYVVRFKDGRQEFHQPISGPLKDTNGNFIEFNADTLGRSALKDSSGNAVAYTTASTSTPISPNFPTTSCGSIPFSVLGASSFSPVTSLTLPNGRTYTFQYDSAFGELTRIDLPTGGFIRYVWTTLAEFDNPPTIFMACRLDSRRLAQRIVSDDGVTEKVWNYSYSRDGSTFKYTTTVTDPLGNQTVHLFDRDGVRELEREVRQGATTPLQKTVNTWISDWGPVQTQQNSDQRFAQFQEFDDKNRRISSTVTTLFGTGGAANRVSKEEFLYDGDSSSSVESMMNLLERKEYDFGDNAPGPLRRRTTFLYLHTSNTNYLNRHIWDRVTLRKVLDAAGAVKAQTALSYDTTTITATSGVVQHDYTGFPSTMTFRGNLTEEWQWLNTTGTWLVTKHFYNDLGNRTKTQDPLLHNTTFSYTDSWTNSLCSPGTNKAQAFLTQATNHLGHLTKFSYYSCSSLLASTTDPNNRVSSFTYDKLDRQKTMTFPDTGLVSNYYSDLDLTATHQGSFVFLNRGSVLPPRAKSFSRIQASPLLEKVDLTVFDGLGRPLMTGASNNSKLDWVRTEYDGKGRLLRTSNPLSIASTTEVPSASSFTKWTTNTYDGLDRITKITFPDAQFSTTAYSANLTTFTDPVGNARKSTFDALGRLTAAQEPNPLNKLFDAGSFTTTYTYDVLDNLTQVTQGAQTRSFVYDSLGRLTSETNPESGVTTYTYNSDSLLTQKKDARNITSTFAYDTLHRNTSITYSDGTPTAGFTYDSTLVTNGKGRRTGMSDGTGSSAFHYDSMGRISKLTRTTQGVLLNLNYTYNLAGGVTLVSAPELAATTLHFTFDNAAREKSFNLNNGALSIVDNYTFTYSGSSASDVFDFGNNTTETIGYNERLQPVTRTVSNPSVISSLTFGFKEPVTLKNNGNVYSVKNNLNLNWDQDFTYDALNRIKTFASPGMGNLTISLDRYGNRTIQTGTGGAPSKSLSISGTTNRITTTGYGYDLAGNLTAEPGRSYQYDAESRVKSANTGTLTTYGYDGEGRRTVKSGSSGTRLYFYDAAGRPIAESGATQGSWLSAHGYFQSRHVFENTAGQLFWRHTDHLATAVIRTNTSGLELCDSRYYPYGEEATSTCASDNYKFTGKERDAESGLDYFGARYYGSPLGRFTTPDESFVDQFEDDPQSWNLYSYVRNNPIRFRDPTGQACRQNTDTGKFFDDDAPGQSCAEVDLADFNTIESGQFSAQVTGLLPFVPLNPAVASALGEAGLRAQVLTQPAVHGLTIFGFVVAPVTMAIAECAAGECSAGNIGLAVVPKLGPIGRVIGRSAGAKEAIFTGKRITNELAQQLGIPRRILGRAVERIKDAHNLPGKVNVAIGRATGDVYHPHTGELIGNVFDEVRFIK